MIQLTAILYIDCQKRTIFFLFTICYFSKMCYCFFLKALLIFGRLVYNRQLRKSRFSYNC